MLIDHTGLPLRCCMILYASATLVAIPIDIIVNVTADSKALHCWCQLGTHTNTLQERTHLLSSILAHKKLLGSEYNASSWQGPGEPGICRGFIYWC